MPNKKEIKLSDRAVEFSSPSGIVHVLTGPGVYDLAKATADLSDEEVGGLPVYLTPEDKRIFELGRRIGKNEMEDVSGE